jgi:hypothetical protein
VLEILASHRAPDIDPEGVWFDVDGRGAWFLNVARQADSGHWTLRNEFLRPDRPRAPTSGAEPEVFTTSGVLSDGVLSLESPLGRSSRLHLCRFADKELLLPERNVLFERDSIPSGMVFQRMFRGPSEIPSISPAIDYEDLRGEGGSRPSVVEDLPAGTWEGVECPEWAWLDIRSTGAAGEYRVRRSRLRGDDPTPVYDFTRASWKADVLVFDPPLFGHASWRLRHSAEEDMLVPETSISAKNRDPVNGMRFRLTNRVTTSQGPRWGQVDVPDAEKEYRDY